MKLRKILFGLNILIAVPCLLVSLLPFLESGGFWFIGILGLVFPFFIAAQFLFFILWLLKRSRLILLPVITFILSWQQISATFAFRNRSGVADIRPDGTIRIMSWNVSRWDERNKEKRGGASYRKLMLDFIALQNTDILCLQEFFECYAPEYFEANIPALEKMGFKYHFFYPSSQVFEGKFKYGLIILSRFPIIQSGGLNKLPSAHSEGLAYADISISKRVLRIYTTHLESPGIRGEDYTQEQNIKLSGSLVSKLKRSYTLRNKQASILRKEMDRSPHPAILCANLDDVPNSYAYFETRGSLNDAFLKTGFGMGRTIRFISPTLRTDYIFLDSRFQLKQFERLIIPYSDHYPQVADFSF
jgi:endonuclease/exonuclease/phosphatase family metal-dependent hydrolase